MTKTDLSKIDVPKSLRLNMTQRKAIAERMAHNAKEKAIEEYDNEAVSKSLTDRLLAEVWQSTELRAAAEDMPEGFFPVTDRLNVAVLSLKEHETGARGEKTKYVFTDNMTFMLSDEDKVLIPYALKNYLAISVEHDEKITAWKASHANYHTTIDDKDLERDLAHHLQFKSRVNEAARKLQSQAMHTLKSIKSVRELQENWPDAFEVYHDLYAAQLQGKSLVPAAPISAVSQMIADFPDINDVMAA